MLSHVRTAAEHCTQNAAVAGNGSVVKLAASRSFALVDRQPAAMTELVRDDQRNRPLMRSALRYQTPGASGSVQNNANNSNTCNGHFRDRPPDISGPEHVITQEVIRGLDWREVISPDGVACLVAQIARR
jgi:hypothetical protein